MPDLRPLTNGSVNVEDPASTTGTATTQTAAANVTLARAANRLVVITVATTIVTLPASPVQGDQVVVKAFQNGFVATNAGQTFEGGEEPSPISIAAGLAVVFMWYPASTTWVAIANYGFL